jgi:hypothetical protein
MPHLPDRRRCGGWRGGDIDRFYRLLTSRKNLGNPEAGQCELRPL